MLIPNIKGGFLLVPKIIIIQFKKNFIVKTRIKITKYKYRNYPFETKKSGLNNTINRIID